MHRRTPSRGAVIACEERRAAPRLGVERGDDEARQRPLARLAHLLPRRQAWGFRVRGGVRRDEARRKWEWARWDKAKWERAHWQTAKWERARWDKAKRDRRHSPRSAAEDEPRRGGRRCDAWRSPRAVASPSASGGTAPRSPAAEGGEGPSNGKRILTEALGRRIFAPTNGPRPEGKEKLAGPPSWSRPAA